MNGSNINQAGTHLLTSEQFSDFVYYLTLVTGDDFAENSRNYLLARETFNIFLKRQWTREHFQRVIEHFIETHKSGFWYPSDFFDIYKKLFVSDGMVL